MQNTSETFLSTVVSCTICLLLIGVTQLNAKELFNGDSPPHDYSFESIPQDQLNMIGRSFQTAKVGNILYIGGVGMAYGSILLTVINVENWEAYFLLGMSGFALQKIGLPIVCAQASKMAFMERTYLGKPNASAKIPWTHFIVSSAMELGALGIAITQSEIPGIGAVLFFGKQAFMIAADVSANRIIKRVYKSISTPVHNAEKLSMSWYPVLSSSGGYGVGLTGTF